jgi:hypothetical protein
VIPPEGDADNARNTIDEVLSQSRIETEIVVLKSDNAVGAVKGHIGASGILFAGLKRTMKILMRLTQSSRA